MNRSVAIGGSIILILATLLGVYFFVNRSSVNEMLAQKAKVEKKLAAAKEKRNKDKVKLDNMIKSFRSANPLAVIAEEQVNKISEIVDQTDYLFNNPNELDPELIVKNLLSKLDINNERKDINILISEWKKKTDIFAFQNIGIKEIEKLKQDTLVVKNFIDDLTKVVGALTPENSGLTEYQIFVYLSELPSINTVNEVLKDIQTAIDNFNSNQNPSTNTNPVSPSDIVTQQTIVFTSQAAVDTLQTQLDQINQNIPPVTPPTDTTIIPPPPQSPPPVYENFYIPESATRDPIIIQPGPPRLIQGDNQY